MIVALKRAGKYVRRGFDRNALERANAIARVKHARRMGSGQEWIRHLDNRLMQHHDALVKRQSVKPMMKSELDKSFSVVHRYNAKSLSGANLLNKPSKAEKVYHKLKTNRSKVKQTAIVGGASILAGGANYGLIRGLTAIGKRKQAKKARLKQFVRRVASYQKG